MQFHKQKTDLQKPVMALLMIVTVMLTLIGIGELQYKHVLHAAFVCPALLCKNIPLLSSGTSRKIFN